MDGNKLFARSVSSAHCIEMWQIPYPFLSGRTAKAKSRVTHVPAVKHPMKTYIDKNITALEFTQIPRHQRSNIRSSVTI